MNSNSSLHEIAQILRQQSDRLLQFQVVAGFDGFVDEIISVVQERSDLNTWSAVRDISSFGDLIKAAAGRSSLREIVVHRADPGGCAVNLGDGLIALGAQLDCFATLGKPRHAAFEHFAAQCQNCYSWGREPGRTLAFEFSDGKLMFSAVTQLAEFDELMLINVLKDGTYTRACEKAHLIALTDWTLYPHMTGCWRKLQKEVYSKLKHKPFLFIDIVDPSSRSIEDIRTMMETLSGFEESCMTVLGLNGNEANVLAKVAGIPMAGDNPEQVLSQTNHLRDHLNISQIVVHCQKFACFADRTQSATVSGPYCPNPKKSTGAGDRFNAGYCCGLFLGMSPEKTMLLASAASGYFVRHAKSASVPALADFIQQWAENKLEN
ncbi:MAG TPA: PfkB family carbohydrate kinase [Candidatus Paceibacterota bacterium]|nr:PfkB family carbohydrate kinase [Candidatus Paceibacterota bacterium]